MVEIVFFGKRFGRMAARNEEENSKRRVWGVVLCVIVLTSSLLLSSCIILRIFFFGVDSRILYLADVYIMYVALCVEEWVKVERSLSAKIFLFV